MQPLLVSKKLMLSMTEPDSDDGPTNPSFHLCQICNEVDKQYRCPRCGMFTCSLKCCKTHKMKNLCNGLRDRSEFVSARDFQEKHLRNDFHFLEDVLQTKDRAKRLLEHTWGRSSLGVQPRADRQVNKRHRQRPAATSLQGKIPLMLQPVHQRLEQYSKATRALFVAAQERGTQLVLMPPGMTKRTANSSHYAVREKLIYWKVFVVFIVRGPFTVENLLRIDLLHSKAALQLSMHEDCLASVFVDRVGETTVVADLLTSLLDPAIERSAYRHALRPLRLQRDHLQCFLHRFPSPTSSPVFMEVSLENTLRDALQGAALVEYPVLFVGTTDNTRQLSRLVLEMEQSVDAAAGLPPTIAASIEGSETNTLENDSSSDPKKSLLELGLICDYSDDEADDNCISAGMSEGRSVATDNSQSTPSSLLKNIRITDSPELKTTIGPSLINWRHAVSKMISSLETIPRDVPVSSTKCTETNEVEVGQDAPQLHDEEFLSALEQYATADIESLKAIIANAEATDCADV